MLVLNRKKLTTKIQGYTNLYGRCLFFISQCEAFIHYLVPVLALNAQQKNNTYKIQNTCVDPIKWLANYYIAAIRTQRLNMIRDEFSDWE